MDDRKIGEEFILKLRKRLPIGKWEVMKNNVFDSSEKNCLSIRYTLKIEDEKLITISIIPIEFTEIIEDMFIKNILNGIVDKLLKKGLKE